MTRPAVITFYSYKGGVGRTLLAANIAVALAARGKTLLWDLDVEAPGMHRIRALHSEGAIKRGFFDWLVEWQTHRERALGKSDLKKFVDDIRRTPFNNLSLLPAHGDDADAAGLYFGIDWHFLLGSNPTRGRDLFNELLSHLSEQGYRHVVLDSRTGLTDLGALISGVIPDATVLVGGYGAQNLGGLAQAWRALKRDDTALKELRGDQTPPELFLVASAIPQDDASLVAAGRELWAKNFGIELAGVLEIPFDARLLFSEELLVGQEEREVAKAYRKLAGALEDFLDRREEGEQAADEERRARPDIFPEREHDKRLSRVKQGKRFEDLVADLLRLHGYTVESEQLVDSNRVDLVARIQSGVDVTTYLVECKDRKGAVGKKTLETLKGWLEQPKARAMGARGMVVARSFAPAAVAYGKDHGIRLITPPDLERQLLDFGPYLAGQIAAFEASTLASAYVTQKARLGADAQKTEPASSRGADQQGERREGVDDLVDYGLQWANGRGNRLWVLLGDYGTGKTAFTQKLAYELAKRAREDADASVPLLVNLRDVANKASLEEVLHEHWQRASGQRKDPGLFLYLMEHGRLVLLLDSFDEMGIATAGRSVVEQLRSLVRVTGQPGETARANRVLVTCREQFFKEHGEAVRAAAGSDDRISELQRVTLSFDGAIDALERFTEEQVREYLVKRLGTTEGEKAATFLREHYLTNLADRPQLLDIIIKSLPRLRQLEAAGGRPVTTGALYQAYTNEWLEDFKPRERESSSEQLRTILELLAGVLWGRAGNRIHYGDLYALFKDRADLRGALDPQQLDIELRTAAFLSRTPDGHYGFSHRSFLEYFLARRIEHATTAGDSAMASAHLAEALDTARLSTEVCGFVDDLVARDSPQREGLRGALRAVLTASEQLAGPSKAARGNALWLAYQLSKLSRSSGETSAAGIRDQDEQYVPANAQLAGTDLSELALRGIVLVWADLRGVNAERTDFSLARMDRSNLTGAHLRRASLLSASLKDTVFKRADCADVVASGADCEGMQARDSSWINARLDDANVEAVDFGGADLRASCLSGARGQASMESANIIGATARGAEQMPVELVQPRVDRLVPALRNLEAHSGSVGSVAWSPDGARLATVSTDRTVRVWDAATGALVYSLEEHGGWVGSVAWSPDGTRLATGSSDGTVRVWAAATGALVRSLEEHGGSVRSVAWSPDGARLATGSSDGTVRVWDAATGALVRSLEGHRGRVRSVAWSPDGARLATGSTDRTVRVWDAATGALVRSLEEHGGSVRSVAWSPDGARLATGSTARTVRVWDAATGALVRSFEGHGRRVGGVAWSPDGAQLATASDDQTVRVWDAATGALVRSLEGHGDRVGSVAWSPDGARLAASSDDRAVRVWDAATGALVRSLEGHRGSVGSVAWSPDGARLATGNTDQTVRVWDAATGALVRSLKEHGHWVLSVAWSPDGARLATGSDDHTVRVWDAATGALVRSLEGHRGSVQSVAWSPDGARLAASSDDQTVRVWDAATGALVRNLEGHRGSVRSVAWSPDGTRLATGSGDDTVRVWDAATGALLIVCTTAGGGWLSLDYRSDTRGLWQGAGAALELLAYHDPHEPMRPAPWIPRYWRAVDLPELAVRERVERQGRGRHFGGP